MKDSIMAVVIWFTCLVSILGPIYGLEYYANLPGAPEPMTLSSSDISNEHMVVCLAAGEHNPALFTKCVSDFDELETLHFDD